jgi:hypothetical protein
VPFVPPYLSQDQRVNIQQMRDWAKREFIGWDRDEVRGYFIAGGGREGEFDRYHQLLLQDAQDAIQAIDSGRYHSAGGGLTYLIAAQKSQR